MRHTSAGVVLAVLLLSGCGQSKQTQTAQTNDKATPFVGGYPTGDTAQKAYDDADLNSAVQAYKFFYPTVSIESTWKGNAEAGLSTNNQFVIMKGSPKQLVFTPNSDTPYEGANIDLTDGPMVVELPPGPLMCVVNDLNQRYVMDMGLPGPDAGKGGKHVILPPGYKGKAPAGYFAGTPTTNRVLLLVRAIPPAGNVDAAVAMLKTVKMYPLNNPAAASKVTWFDVGDKHIDFTPVPFEKTIGYWNQLAEVINREPAYEGYRMEYGLLASLGIEKGKPFSPGRTDAGHFGKGSSDCERPDASSVVCRSAAGPRCVAGQKMGMGDIAPGERNFRHRDVQRFGSARKMVLPGANRIARDVPAVGGCRFALLARHTRRQWRVSRRQQDVQVDRAAACPRETFLVAYDLRS